MDHANSIERLTARERETLRLASTHMSSKEIARQLGISHRTVDKHLEGAMHKLGVGSRRDATRLLIHEAVLRSLTGLQKIPLRNQPPWKAAVRVAILPMVQRALPAREERCHGWPMAVPEAWS